jgi:hypothetical protein
MFETLPGSALATWRSACWPIEGPTPLHRLKDHRRVYLDFEGELSGHRGRVSRVAAGKCTVEVGENAVWTIHLLMGTSPGKLILEWKTGDTWQGVPIPDGPDGRGSLEPQKAQDLKTAAASKSHD